jgi:hypothetical protein
MSATPFDDLEPYAVLCAKDIADRLHVDPRSVPRAIARGDLPASRACGLRVLAVDAAEWWRSRAIVAEPAERSAPVPAPAEPPSRRRQRFERTLSRLPLPERAGGS